jgi:signal transduction histidine kinase/CheY-like chemotaxis protein
MSENFPSLESAAKYFETVKEGIAITDNEYKIIWYNKKFKEIFELKKLKGASFLKVIENLTPLKFTGILPDSISLPTHNSIIRIIPVGAKKKAGSGYIIKVELNERKFAEGYDEELLKNNLLFQSELKNILSLLLKEKSLKVISEELLIRCLAISGGDFGLVILHNELNKYSFHYYDPGNLLTNRQDIEKELNSNFSFLNKWFSINEKSLIALNMSDNIGYNLVRTFQSQSLVLTPCLFDNKLLATIIIGKQVGGFSPLEINNVEQFAAILSFSISSIITSELNIALESRLLQAQKLETIGKLSSGMAHDFNNLLSSIFGSINLLKKRVEPREEITRLLDNIESCSIRAKDLTKGLLSFGKPTQKRKELIKPNDLLNEITKVIKQTFPKRINLVTSFSESLYDILGSGTEIYQVLLNLCVNAKEAIEEKGTITLNATNITIGDKNLIQYPLLKMGKYTHFQVIDSGSGIKEENLLKIFDPYFSTKIKDTGSGLGLYVTYGIIKAHQGHIEVSSVENENTTFDVFLPAFEPKAAEKTAPENKIILLADDEIMLRDLLAELLESNGFNVIKVSSGLEVLTLLTEEIKVDLIIMDFNMPEMNGLECIEKVRELNFNMPIILSTGSLNIDSKFDIQKIGINSILLKPYEFDTMFSTIQKLL